MTSRAPDLLASIFDRPGRVVALRGGAIAMKARELGAFDFSAEPAASPAPRRRTAIWTMHQSVHCSIIGTCLSGGELRRLMIKLGVDGAASADDHTLHKQAVALAGRPQDGARL